MKTLISIIALAMALLASAQQVMFDPSTSDQTLVCQSLEVLSDGDIVSVGFMGDYAHIFKSSSSGSISWSKKCDHGSAFYGSTVATTSDIIGVGYQYSTGLVSAFTPSGALAWSRTFASGADTVVTFYGIDTDASGNVYVVGDKYKFPQRREVLIKLDASGNVLCERELQSTTNDTYTRRVFVRNNALFVFGGGVWNTRGISVAKYNLAGSLQGYRVFGGFGGVFNPDNFLDVVETPSGFVFSYTNGNMPGTIMLARVDESLALVGNPMYLQQTFPDFWSAYLGDLAIDPDGSIYVSGSMAGNSANYSFVLKVSGDLATPLWGKRFPVGVSVNSVVRTRVHASGGNIIFVNNSNNTMMGSNTGFTVATLSRTNGDMVGFGCASSQPFAFQMVADWLTTNSLPRTTQAVSFGMDLTTFGPYTPRVNNCGTMLPVELVYFQGNKNGEAVELDWVTATELNNSHFTVLRSRDGIDWQEVGRVVGVGTSQTPNDYKFRDENPLLGGNYYRLVQVDLDGTETPSDVVFVSFERELGVYPNPVSSGEVLRVNDGKPFQVFDGQGKVVIESSVDQVIIALVPGVYFVRGVDSATAKLIVK